MKMREPIAARGAGRGRGPRARRTVGAHSRQWRTQGLHTETPAASTPPVRSLCALARQPHD
eukprot:7381103-Prymnesium_polylepis.1